VEQVERGEADKNYAEKGGVVVYSERKRQNFASRRKSVKAGKIDPREQDQGRCRTKKRPMYVVTKGTVEYKGKTDSSRFRRD